MVPINSALLTNYKPYLCRLMAYKDGRETPYPTAMTFGRGELMLLTADDVTEFFNLMAFGTATPGPNNLPTHCRSSSLEQAKKGISYFMPNKHIPWNVDTNVGNPTRSPQVMAVIRVVKRFEVRRQGRLSKAKRELTMAEFRMTVHDAQAGVLGRSFDLVTKLPTMLKTQVHIIGRIDDISHMPTDSIKSHHRFSFCLETKLMWSKNVLEERSCPTQIMMGAADVDFCVLLGTLLTLLFVSACCGQYTNLEL